MCRNIKTLFNFEPPVTPDEVQAASLQFVRKISGFTKPSKANEEAFLTAVDDIARLSASLLRALENERCAEESGRRSGQGRRARGPALRHLKAAAAAMG